MKKIRFVSLFASDLSHIIGTLEKLKRPDIRTIHIDLMNGQFLPNTALSEARYKQINRKRFEVNAQLMVSAPDEHVEKHIATRPMWSVSHTKQRTKLVTWDLLAK